MLQAIIVPIENLKPASRDNIKLIDRPANNASRSQRDNCFSLINDLNRLNNEVLNFRKEVFLFLIKTFNHLYNLFGLEFFILADTKSILGY